GDAGDVALALSAHVEQRERVARVELLLQLAYAQRLHLRRFVRVVDFESGTLRCFDVVNGHPISPTCAQPVEGDANLAGGHDDIASLLWTDREAMVEPGAQ